MSTGIAGASALSDLDRSRLEQALALANSAIGLSDPNPRVGCVIGFADGRVAGTGHTQRAGEAHAEVMALRDATGQDLHGATAWVTLEPCSHHGRTPPCCDALINAGVTRVVCAIGDPNPLVGGQGLARLRAAGVEVQLADADLQRQARDLNIGFFTRMITGTPWVRMKVAASLDGVTALHNGRSQWITGEAARVDGHAWRRRASAILTGIGTVLADNPRLDVRLVESALQPLRVVVDSRLRMPPDARILAAPGSAMVVCTAAAADRRPQSVASGLVFTGAETADGRIELRSLLQQLARQGVNELHVEAGPTLNAALLRAGLVDELLLYLAPKLLGAGARPLAAFGPLDSLDEAIQLELASVTTLGSDLRLLARVRR